jgi:ABC-type lipoprotein release transport system permease subunit
MVLWRIAFRNIWLHRLRTLVVGGILTFGTILLIVGNATMDAVEKGMERSIVRTVSGHLQVYDKNAEDDIALYGRPGMVEVDMGKIDDFDKVKRTLEGVDNVESVVPLGMGHAIVFGDNAIDLKLALLRKAVYAKDVKRIDLEVAHLRQMLEVLKDNVSVLHGIVALTETDKKRLAAVNRVTKSEFWGAFQKDPLAGLEFLENNVAPAGPKADMFFLRYFGTDPQAFAKHFDLFEILEGKLIPDGRRGIMINRLFRERRFKNRIAYTLDKIGEAREEQSRTIKEDEELQQWLARNIRQYRTIMMELDREETKDLTKELAAFLKVGETDIAALLKQFLDMNDENFKTRVAWFYKHIAPRVRLYHYSVGDSIVITAMTRRGFPRSVRLKIYGVFQFKSLEKSVLAGSHHIMDLLTWRELYGYLTPEQVAENKKLIAKEGKTDAKAATDEDAMFGEGSELVDTQDDSGFDEFQGVDLGAHSRKARQAQRRPYSQSELEEGIALNAAVFLKDPTKLQQTQAAIDVVSKKEGLRLQSLEWNKASGIVGQFTTTIRGVLYISILIIFIVALVIMNNALVMATMERVKEIGTMRAIGAQRGFILRLFLTESLVLSILFGIIGGVLGSGIVLLMESSGIPATHEMLRFLFGGPVLRPELTFGHVISAATTCVVVAVVSTFYPAMIATRIQPVMAMQAKE